MGDRFIQLGDSWRLADIDGRHLVLQHIDGGSDGILTCFLRPHGEIPVVWTDAGKTMRRPAWGESLTRVAWGREIGRSEGISPLGLVNVGNPAPITPK